MTHILPSRGAVVVGLYDSAAAPSFLFTLAALEENVVTHSHTRIHTRLPTLQHKYYIWPITMPLFEVRGICSKAYTLVM